MRKTLTISIAAYNVERFIRKTLESCIAEEIMEDLEVLVIDDGATDGTAEIVKEYEEKYPKIFRLIHKENGGYGTTVNRSMKEASGRYFKLLDGDDWFDTEGLIKLIKHLKNTDADAVFTKMYLCYPNYRQLEKDSWENLAGKRIKLSDVPKNVFAGMWEFTVKTSILKDHPFELPSKTLYTDHLFLAYPIPFIGEVEYLDFPVYCYRIGYDEQSISTKSRLKHMEEIVRVSWTMSEYYKKHTECKNRGYLLERTRFCFMEALRTLLLPESSYESYKNISILIKNTQKISNDIINAAWNGEGNRAFRVILIGKYPGYFVVKLKQIRKLRGVSFI